MYFGKYLLDKGAVSAEQLVQAVTKLETSQPSFFEVLSKSKLISAEKLIEVLSYSIQNKKDFQASLLEVGALEQNQIFELQQKQAKLGLSLGQALVELNSLTREKLNELIHDYNKFKKEQPEPGQVAAKNSEPTLSQAALESLGELGIVDEKTMSDLESQVAVPEKKEVEEASGDNAPISSAALESLSELGIVDESTMSELESQAEVTEPTQTNSETEDSQSAPISSAALESLSELGIVDESTMSELEAKAESEPKVSAEPAISAAALESLGELGIVDEETMSELENSQADSEVSELMSEDAFVEKFNDELHSSLITEIKSMTKGFDAEKIKNVHKDITELLGAATFEEHKLISKILVCYQRVLDQLLNEEIDLVENNYLNIISQVKTAVELVWEQREQILSHGSELSLEENDSSWKQKYLNCLKGGVGIATKKVAS